MSVAPAVGELRCALTVGALTAWRAARSAAVWGLMFGLLIFNEAPPASTGRRWESSPDSG